MAPTVRTALQLTPLRRDDGEAVRRWLRAYLRHHNKAWVQARGLGWSTSEIDAQMLASDLVSDHWHRLQRVAARDDHHVRIARLEGRPVGCAWAAQRVDDYLQVHTGVLNWVFTDGWARGHGIGSALVVDAKAWMRREGLRTMMVSVLADNPAAQRLYARHGMTTADVRMMGSLVGDADGAS